MTEELLKPSLESLFPIIRGGSVLPVPEVIHIGFHVLADDTEGLKLIRNY